MSLKETHQLNRSEASPQPETSGKQRIVINTVFCILKYSSYSKLIRIIFIMHNLNIVPTLGAKTHNHENNHEITTPSINTSTDYTKDVQDIPQQKVFTYTYLACLEDFGINKHLDENNTKNIENGICFGLTEMAVNSPDKFNDLVTLQNIIFKPDDKEKFTATGKSVEEKYAELNNSLNGITSSVKVAKKEDKERFITRYEEAIALSNPKNQSNEADKYNQVFGRTANDMHNILSNFKIHDSAFKIGIGAHELSAKVRGYEVILYDPNRELNDKAESYAFTNTEDGHHKLFQYVDSYYGNGNHEFVISTHLATSKTIDAENLNFNKVDKDALANYYNLASSKNKKIIANTVSSKLKESLEFSLNCFRNKTHKEQIKFNEIDKLDNHIGGGTKIIAEHESTIVDNVKNGLMNSIHENHKIDLKNSKSVLDLTHAVHKSMEEWNNSREQQEFGDLF